MKLSSGLEYDTGPKTPWYKKMSCRKIHPSDLKSTKFLLYSATTLLTITGLMLLVTGIVVLDTCNRFDIVLGDFFVFPGLLMSTAFIIFLTAILGAYGMIYEKYKSVIGYIALLVIILIFVSAITGLAYDKDVLTPIRRDILRRNPYSSFGPGGRMRLEQFWDDMHRELRCCDFDDFHSGVAPISCCPMPPGTRSPFECTLGNSYIFSCAVRLHRIMFRHLIDVGIIGIVALCIQVLVIGIAICIARRIKNKKNLPQHEIIMRDALKIEPSNPTVIDYSRF